MIHAQARPTPDTGGPVIGAGEKFGLLHFTVRQNYVVPQATTVEEGWYRIVVDDPSRVAPAAAARLEDERGTPLTGKTLAAQGAKTSLYFRLSPGRQRLRVGTKGEWVVQVTVEARKR